MSKLKSMLVSRKFWAMVFVIVASLALFAFGQIDGVQLIAAITLASGIYAGSVAVEDGLSAAIRSWVSNADR